MIKNGSMRLVTFTRIDGGIKEIDGGIEEWMEEQWREEARTLVQ